MAQLSINFIVDVARALNQDPMYRISIQTGILGVDGAAADGDLLVIERKSALSGPVDVFYGIAKAVDFAALRKGAPNVGQTLFRSHQWNLVFYNQKTMDEAISLMKVQVDILAEDLAILTKFNNNRSETHISPLF